MRQLIRVVVNYEFEFFFRALRGDAYYRRTILFNASKAPNKTTNSVSLVKQEPLHLSNALHYTCTDYSYFPFLT
jgi:hypothetical protein